jgi:hypothetical protein
MLRKRLMRRALVGGALISALAVVAPTAAFAAPAVGTDANVQTNRGAGSDTTYPMMQKIEELWNGSPGCVLDATVSNAANTYTDGAITAATTTLTSNTAFFSTADVGLQVQINGAGPAGGNLTTFIGAFTNPTTVTVSAAASTTVSGATIIVFRKAPFSACTASQPATVETKANYDHDVMIGEYPSGSSAGVSKVLNGFAQYARSSRARKTDGSEDALAFVAYAKDGLTVVSFSGRPGSFADPTDTNLPNLTIAQLATIFGSTGATCTSQNWSTYTDPATGLPYPSASIKPYGIQTSSGTFSTMQTKLGVNPNNCAQAIMNAAGQGNACDEGTYVPANCRILFENNTAPIDGGTGTDGVNYAAAAADRADAIWWMSFGDFSTSSNRRGTAKAWRVDGTVLTNGSISDDSYHLTRQLFHVMKKADLQATSGQAGQNRTFRDWLCRPGVGTANHAKDIGTGKTFDALIVSAINKSGFVRMSTLQGNSPYTGGATEKCFTDAVGLPVAP